MNLSWFLAHRLYSHGGDVKRVSKPAIRIATIGVALGVAVMIVSLCVVLGFKREVQRKVMGMGGHIQVLNYNYMIDHEQHPIVIDDSLTGELLALDGVRHIQRFCCQPGMLKTDEAFQGVVLKGIGQDYDYSFLKDNLQDGELPQFTDSVASNSIVISRLLAKQLKLNVGDKVYTYFFDGNIRARRFTVSAVYSTNMAEFDKQLIFTDIYTTHKLTGYETDQFSGAELEVNNLDDLYLVGFDVANTVNHRQDRYGNHYTSPTIRELYPGVFSWLSLLDTNVVVILCLMIAVAAFTMISGLLIIILERTQFIGIMKALGATNGRLRHIFLYFASLIVFKGVVIGNLLGLGLVALQITTGIISLDAETYYVDVVPLEVNWLYVALVNVGTLLVSVFVLVLPSYVVCRIHPAQSIRFE